MSVILFVPAYDDSTTANLGVARHIKTGADHRLFADDATTAALAELLRGTAAPIFAMSHGRPDHLCAQHGEAAIHADDCLSLAGRQSYVYACHTANELGRAVADAGGVWWGYTGAVSAPPIHPEAAQEVARLFRLLKENVFDTPSKDIRLALMLELRRLCDEVSEALDQIDFPDFCDQMSAHSCVLHVWDRLRVWCRLNNGPERHPDSQDPVLFGMA